jgi:hypothetical protein
VPRRGAELRRVRDFGRRVSTLSISWNRGSYLRTIARLKIATGASIHCGSGSARARSNCKSPAAKS